MKVMSVNANYFLGYDGSPRSYARAHRWVRAKKAEEKSMEALTELIEDENPDIICLIEADPGSFFNRENTHLDVIQQKFSERDLKYSHDHHNKYGNWLSKLPKFQEVSNSVMWKDDRDAEVEAHYLGSGTKQLMHEIRVGDISIFSVHLPLTKKTRKRQMKRMAEIINDREKAIVTGDFNNYHGLEELEELLELTELEVFETGKTFPAHNPRYMLDFFLVTPDIDVNDTQVIDQHFSDHRPVMLEAELEKSIINRLKPDHSVETIREKASQIKEKVQIHTNEIV